MNYDSLPYVDGPVLIRQSGSGRHPPSTAVPIRPNSIDPWRTVWHLNVPVSGSNYPSYVTYWHNWHDHSPVPHGIYLALSYSRVVPHQIDLVTFSSNLDYYTRLP